MIETNRQRAVDQELDEPKFWCFLKELGQLRLRLLRRRHTALYTAKVAAQHGDAGSGSLGWCLACDL